jgi:hypothetical protein
MDGRVGWPDGKRFAFTVFDDTDHTTLANGPEVYRLLADLGLRTTKSVWPILGERVPTIGGATCEDPSYLAWVHELERQGFEIALHNATFHGSLRLDALRGLEEFRRLFGRYPRIHVNHADCEDAIYWGSARLSGWRRGVYDVLTRNRMRRRDGGSRDDSEYFWGDACQRHVRYVRNFVYADMNTLKRCPWMPYHDPERPYVNAWFASSEGANAHSFCRTIAEANQDRLEEEGGACIMYTHFGHPTFFENGRLSPRFVALLTRLADKGGWFVPVSDLLDHIDAQRGTHVIGPRERAHLERRWLLEKVFVTRGTS